MARFALTTLVKPGLHSAEQAGVQQCLEGQEDRRQGPPGQRLDARRSAEYNDGLQLHSCVSTEQRLCRFQHR